jgi:hypothetical protein
MANDPAYRPGCVGERLPFLVGMALLLVLMSTQAAASRPLEARTLKTGAAPTNAKKEMSTQPSGSTKGGDINQTPT